MKSARYRPRVLGCVVTVGAAVAIGVFACLPSGAAVGFDCRPQPALGSLALRRGGRVHVINLTSCRDQVMGGGIGGRAAFGADGRVHVLPVESGLISRDGRFVTSVRVTGKQKTLRNTIWVADRRTGKAHAVLSVGVRGDTSGRNSPGPIMLLGWSGNARWLFYAIDPGGSGSIAADGLILQVVSVGGGASHRLGVMLPYPDYLSWCGGRLIFTAGVDRVATNNKRLLVAAPPDWQPRPLVRATRRAWGSLTCAPDNRSVMVQSQSASTNSYFFATHWALWRVGLEGSKQPLTSPPAGYADESPRFSRDGRTLMFVRSSKGVGKLYALRTRKLLGPLIGLGYSLGYYGHQDWWQSMDWSLESPISNP